MPGYYRLSYLFFLVLLAVIIAAAPIRASNHIINVPADLPSIQAAIDAAQDGDEIIVASGVYGETIDLLG